MAALTKRLDTAMCVHVLGSAAGGGFPQWNCNCRNCAGLRQGAIRFTGVPLGSETPPYSPHHYAPHRGILSRFGSKTSIPGRTSSTRRWFSDTSSHPSRGGLPARGRYGLDRRRSWYGSGISERRAREMGHLSSSGLLSRSRVRYRSGQEPLVFRLCRGPNAILYSTGYEIGSSSRGKSSDSGLRARCVMTCHYQ